MSDELIAQALIGDEAKKFVESDLGKCLLGMALQEVQAAQEALETVDPANEKAIRDLQNQAWLGRRFEGWLQELITEGENALATWRQGQDEQKNQ
jgi:hypothetical protein